MHKFHCLVAFKILRTKRKSIFHLFYFHNLPIKYTESYFTLLIFKHRAIFMKCSRATF